MKQLICSFILFLTFFLKTEVFAQNYNFSSFSFEQGLNSYNIKKVLQDKYGFLWIATQDGLFRYDGNTFDPMKKIPGSKTSIRENFIFDIALGKNEDLYVSSFNGGIDVVNIRTLEVTYLISQKSDKNDGLPNLFTTNIYFDSNENLWIGGKDYLTIYNVNKRSFNHFKLPRDPDIGVNVSFIRQLGNATIAVGVENFGVLLFDMITQDLLSTISDFEPNSGDNKIVPTDLLVIGENCFISSGSVIYQGQIVNNKWTLIRKIGLKQKHRAVNCFVSAVSNELWIGTNAGILVLDLENYQFKQLENEKLASQSSFIYHLFIDRDNSLWVSSLKNLERIELHNNFFTAFTESQDKQIKMEHIYGLMNKDTAELFACGTDGLYRCNIENGMIKRVKGTEVLGIIHCVYKVKEDLWFVSSDYGMHVYIPGKEIVSRELMLKLYPEWKPFVNNYFNKTLQVGNKVYWASEEQEGLVIWDVQKRVTTQYKAGTKSSRGLPENHLHNIKLDKQGFMWLLFDNSVARFDPAIDSVTEIIRYKQNEKGFNSGIFFDMYDDGNTLWFGTYGGGLNGYNRSTKDWTYITEATGLCNNNVYGILPENDSIFWVSTNNGISRINHINKTCINYFAKDGLHDNSFDETGFLKSGNKLFFAGVNGFTQVNLDLYYSRNISFPVYIKRIEYIHDDKKNLINDLFWDNLSLPPGTPAASIWISALSFSKRPHFSYKIQGYNDEYLSVGGNNKIELNALSHGDYKIDIRYLNEKGQYQENVIGIDLSVLPFWYQTWWFRLLVAFSLSFTIVYIVRFIYDSRLKQQKAVLERQLAIQSERQRISSEMHDDIGAGLSGVRLLTEMTKNKLKDSAATTDIEKIYQSVGDISSKMKEVIWSLNAENDTLDNLVHYIHKQVRSQTENYPGDMLFEMPQYIPDHKISGEARRNIYLMVKEAIHNIIKHSGADKIKISISFDEQVNISVSDNGIGIDNDHHSYTGNGLQNMQQRIQQLSGRLLIKNENGTTLIFSIPFKSIS